MKLSKKIALWITSLFMVAALCFAAGCDFLVTYRKVSFDSNGGTAVESVQVIDGLTIEEPEAPTKEGYTFEGWYLGEEEFSFDQPIKDEFTLMAKWAPNTDTLYTVKHFQENLDGTYEEVVADVETLQGTTDADTNAVAKTYEGFTAQEFAQVKIAPDGSSVVEIKYDRNTVKITWVVDGVPTEEEYKYGATPVHADPTKAADMTYTYTFSGWDAEIVPATEAKTYTANFTPTYINYTVTFKAENGDVISEKADYHYGDTIVAPAALTKAADETYTYTFNGWNNAETVTGNLEYTASFTAEYINYIIVFRNYTNTADILRVENYHFGDTVEVPAHSENLEGYTYGWDKEIVAVNGNAAYVETRTPNTYNVAFVLNGGEMETELSSYVYSVGAALPTNATKVGHQFAGWFASETLEGEVVNEITTSDLGDKTFYAKWTPNTYKVALNVNDGALDTDLTSYVYGVGATLPTCSKKGYTFVGWFASETLEGETVTAIGVEDLGDKTFYAKYTPNQDTKYTVEVFVPQYTSRYSAGYYYMDALTYVDKTSEFASFFGLNEDNKAQGETDSTVDLTALIGTLSGAKLNAESVVSGVIDADESLKLTVKLDFDEDELGFKLSNVCLGQYSWENLVFSLGYMDGTCGLAVKGDLTAWRKELIINMDPVNVTQYASYSLVYYEKGANTQNKFVVNDMADSAGKAYVSATSDEYVKYSLNVQTLFPNDKVVNKLRLSFYDKTEKNVFIKGIEAVEFKKETVTYSMENGNLLGIATPLGAGTVGQVANHTFKNTNEGIDKNMPALLYSYSGDAVTGKHATGVVLNLGGIRVSDYKVIKLTFQTISTVESGNNSGTDIFCGDVQITSQYGGAHVVDVKALAVEKGVTSFDKIELSMSYWAPITSCSIYVASVELVVDENAPALEDVVYNVTLNLDGGEAESELTSYVYGVGATLPNASKENHTFLGWYTTSDFSGDAVTEIGANEFGNKTFYAQFKLNSYNVTLNLNGGTVEEELTSYIGGVGATLPVASRTGYTFAGWYSDGDFNGDAVTEIGADESGDKTFYAKFVPNGDTKYSVKVLVAQYSEGYTSPYYHPGTLTYVDATSEYASFFGLDENNALYGATGASVDLSEKIAMLKGAKLNEASVVSGEISADGSLELTVMLDVDEEFLGFKLSNIKLGKWSCSGLKFTLKYHDGVCGLAIDGTIGNGKEILIEVDEIVAANYASVVFNYYEKSATTNMQMTVSDTVVDAEVLKNHVSMLTATAPTDYVKASVDVLGKLPTVSSIKQFSIKPLGGGEKHIFISGLELVACKKETVTYNINNGNLLGIATSLDEAGKIDHVANHTFVSTNSPALRYTYSGEGDRGLVMD